MNRRDAKEIAKTVTNEQLQTMFNNAKANMPDWTQVSSVNKGITKGVGWNILARNFDVKKNYMILAKINMVHEFGDFLPDHLKPKKVKKYRDKNPPVHQDPIF